MKKKELLGMKQLKATSRFMKVVDEDKGEEERGYIKYKYQIFIRAVEENGILKVAIFTRKYLKALNKMPMYEVYISKGEERWITYSPLEEKWYSAKIDNLDIRCDWWGGNGQYYSKDTKKIINAYLGTGKMEPRTAILSFQNEIRKAELKNKHRRELDQIDEVMETVPEKPPADFDKWIADKALEDKKYLFYFPGQRKGKCMCCEQEVLLKEKPVHNKEGKCPKCGKKVKYKSWNKQKFIRDFSYVGLMQRLTDDSGFVIRKFMVVEKYEKVKDIWEKTVSKIREIVRKTISKRFTEREFFEYGYYKQTSIERWCHELNHGFAYYCCDTWMGNVRMYTRNFKKLLSDTELKYMPVHEMMKGQQTKEIDILQVLRTLRNNKKYEYVIKAGLKRFALEMCNGHYCGGDGGYVDWTKKRPWECLKISKEQFDICRKNNANREMVRILQVAHEEGVKIDEKQLKWIEKILGVSILIRDMKHTTPHRMIKYLKSIGAEKNRDIARDYADYLDQCKELGWQLNKQTMFPQDFQAAHQMTTQELLEIKDREEAKKREYQDMQYKMNIDEKKTLFEYEDEKYTIVLPESKQDFIQEGRDMHNCVGGYFERVLKGECTVLFLREKKEKEKAFCTVEIEGTKLIQCRATCNTKAPKEAVEFMEKFLKVLEKRLKKKEEKVKVAVAV